MLNCAMMVAKGKRTMEPIIFSEKSIYMEKAFRIADRLKAPLAKDPEILREGGLVLSVGDEGLSLVSGNMKIRGDFSGMYHRIKNNNLNSELLIKAAKIKGRSPEEMLILDGTAGLGEDSFLLAAAGYNVIMFEKDPVIFMMLKDALDRGKNNGEISEIINRMVCFEENSIEALKEIGSKESPGGIRFSGKPDIIYLDPMFPERQKSGLVKKKFQLIHFLEKPESGEEELLNAALGAEPLKIIIKRPLKACALAGRVPSYSIKGKSIRYDCMVL